MEELKEAISKLAELVGTIVGKWIHYAIMGVIYMTVWNYFQPAFNLIPIPYGIWVLIACIISRFTGRKIAFCNKLKVEEE